MRIAITREVSPVIGRCDLIHLPRQPIDPALALEKSAAELQTRADGLGLDEAARDVFVKLVVKLENHAKQFGQACRRDDLEQTERRTECDDGCTAKAPAWVVTGHPDDVVTLHLGYGRTRAGRVGDGLGVNASLLRTSDAPGFGGGLEVKATGQSYSLACTQDHWTMEAQEQVKQRELVRVVELEEYQRDAHKIAEEFARHRPSKGLTLYPPDHQYEGSAWGLVVDLNACVGCNACVVACVAENNIPVVGKEQVALGREMHWIRVDRYYEGGLDNPSVHHQPVLSCFRPACSYWSVAASRWRWSDLRQPTCGAGAKPAFPNYVFTSGARQPI